MVLENDVFLLVNFMFDKDILDCFVRLCDDFKFFDELDGSIGDGVVLC